MLNKERRRAKTRITELSIVAESLLKQLSPHISEQDFLKALTGVHALTGCDTVSAFSRKEVEGNPATCQE